MKKFDPTAGRAKRRSAWIDAVAAVLAERHGAPLGMGQALVAPYAHSNSDMFNIGATPENVEEAAAKLWAQAFARSGFASDQEFVVAWERHGAWNVESLRYAEERALRRANAGFLPERVAELVRPEHIERTLELVFYLNHWAKARDLLFYVDRQGLYTIKARLLAEAYRVGLLKAVARIPSQAEFRPFADPEQREAVAYSGAERILEILRWPANAEELAQYQQLYRRLTGQEPPAIPKKGAIPDETVDSLQRAVEEFLLALEAEARQTRRPVPVDKLEALCLLPSDVIESCDPNERWDDLTSLGPLDPEHYSLVEFRYTSETARYCFHLPLRVAETFVQPEKIAQLPVAGAREEGELFGRAITEQESLAYPILGILNELGASVTVVCPKQLVLKSDYFAARPPRFDWDDEDEYDLDDEDDYDLDD